MEPKEPDQPNFWHIRLDKIDHNYMNDPAESELWHALMQVVAHMALQEEHTHQELTLLEALDAQVQGDELPDVKEMIMNTYRKVRDESRS